MCSHFRVLRKQPTTIKWLVLCRVSVRDLTTLPSYTMLHVRLSLPRLRFLGSKCAVMCSTPAAFIAAAISVPLLALSKSSRSVFRSPATISAVPFGLSPSAVTTCFIFSVSSGAS